MTKKGEEVDTRPIFSYYLSALPKGLNKTMKML